MLAGRYPGGSMQIHRADKTYRRRLLVVLLAAAAAGTASIGALRHWLSHGLAGKTLSPEAALWWLYVAFLALGLTLALGTAVFGAWLWRYAGRVGEARRYPLPAEAIARDTPIREGGAAQALAVRMRTAATALWALAAGLISWVTWVGLRLG